MDNEEMRVQNGCFEHPGRHPVARCVECGVGLCGACVNESGGKYYCKRHIPVNGTQPATSPEPEIKKARIRLVPLLVTLLPAVLLLVAAYFLPDDLSDLLGDYTGRATGVQFQQITEGLESFKDDVGRYPNEGEGLAGLREEPKSAPGWLGPYLPEEYYVDGEVIDAAGRPVEYELREDGYMLTSAGGDGKPGTEDDIAFLGPLK